MADLSAIVDAGLEGAEGHSVDDVLRAVARRLADATHSPVADIYAVEDGSIRALVSYDNGAFDPSWEGKTFRIADYPATRQAIESLQVRVVASLDDPVLTPEVRASLASWGYQSQLSLPLVAHDEVIGLAELSDTVPRDYADDLELIRGLAEVAARAIDNARLFEQVERHNAVLRELVDIGTLVSQSHDVDELLRSVAQRLLTTLDAADCDIYKIQDEGVFTCLVSVDRSGYDESVVGKALRLDLYPLAAEAVRSGERRPRGRPHGPPPHRRGPGRLRRVRVRERAVRAAHGRSPRGRRHRDLRRPTARFRAVPRLHEGRRPGDRRRDGEGSPLQARESAGARSSRPSSTSAR